MANKSAPLIFTGIGMCIEVNHRNFSMAQVISNTCNICRCDGVIATENDRDRTRLSNLANLAVDGAVSVFKSAWVHDGVPCINGGECGERLNTYLQRVQRAGLVLRLTNGAGAKACARTMCDGIVKWCADDRNVRLATTDLGYILNPRKLGEADRPDIRRAIEWVALLWVAVPAERGKGVGKGWGVRAHIDHHLAQMRRRCEPTSSRARGNPTPL